jgi:UDP-N-acetyl-D-galactosamine dehydrogenase
VDVVAELRDYGVVVDVNDPWVDPAEAQKEYGLVLVESPEPQTYDGVVLAVAHDSYRDAGITALRKYGRGDHVFCDLKSVFGRDESDLRL